MEDAAHPFPPSQINGILVVMPCLSVQFNQPCRRLINIVDLYAQLVTFLVYLVLQIWTDMKQAARTLLGLVDKQINNYSTLLGQLTLALVWDKCSTSCLDEEQVLFKHAQKKTLNLSLSTHASLSWFHSLPCVGAAASCLPRASMSHFHSLRSLTTTHPPIHAAYHISHLQDSWLKPTPLQNPYSRTGRGHMIGNP